MKRLIAAALLAISLVACGYRTPQQKIESGICEDILQGISEAAEAREAALVDYGRLRYEDAGCLDD